jgi:hypothetical protein
VNSGRGCDEMNNGKLYKVFDCVKSDGDVMGEK